MGLPQLLDWVQQHAGPLPRDGDDHDCQMGPENWEIDVAITGTLDFEMANRGDRKTHGCPPLCDLFAKLPTPA
jgi:hypothetical protein